MIDHSTKAQTAGFSEVLNGLKSAQKSNKGAPAYSRYVNRRLGRVLAAAAHVRGMAPNQVTLISAIFTFTAIVLIASIEPSPIVSAAVTACLILGYGLDSADGQLARIRGGGTPGGEWLDHVIDSVKVGSLHLAVLVCWWRFYEVDAAWLLVPLGFQVVATVLFFSMILTDQLRRQRRAAGDRQVMRNGSQSSPLYALAVIPTDFGLMCLLFAVHWFQPLFIAVYAALFLANAAFLALALAKWYREVNSYVP